MKYSLSEIIKDLLAKIPVLENRINTLSTKITNMGEISIERGSINDILYFTPLFSMFSPSSGVQAWPASDGKVLISYEHKEEIRYYLDSSIGKFSLTPTFSSPNVSKTVIIVDGGLSTGLGVKDIPGAVETPVVEKYLEDHLDEFKEKAYTLIPESRKATEFVIREPTINNCEEKPRYTNITFQVDSYPVQGSDNGRVSFRNYGIATYSPYPQDIVVLTFNEIPNDNAVRAYLRNTIMPQFGLKHVHLKGHGISAGTDFDEIVSIEQVLSQNADTGKWLSLSYVEDYLTNVYLPEHNLKGVYYSGVIIGRSDGGDATVSGFVMRE